MSPVSVECFNNCCSKYSNEFQCYCSWRWYCAGKEPLGNVIESEWIHYSILLSQMHSTHPIPGEEYNNVTTKSVIFVSWKMYLMLNIILIDIFCWKWLAKGRNTHLLPSGFYINILHLVLLQSPLLDHILTALWVIYMHMTPSSVK